MHTRARVRSESPERSRRPWSHSVLAMALLGIAAACGGETATLEETGLEVEGPFTWGELSNVTRAGSLYFAGQPREAALQEARETGVGVVINLRNPSEDDWDERSAVEALGMSYHNIPVRGVDLEAFSEIDAIVKASGDSGVLVHCGSSNRVGAWYASHLIRERGQTLDDALEAGRKAGMRNEQLVEGIRSLGGAE